MVKSETLVLPAQFWPMDWAALLQLNLLLSSQLLCWVLRLPCDGRVTWVWPLQAALS